MRDSVSKNEVEEQMSKNLNLKLKAAHTCMYVHTCMCAYKGTNKHASWEIRLEWDPWCYFLKLGLQAGSHDHLAFMWTLEMKLRSSSLHCSQFQPQVTSSAPENQRLLVRILTIIFRAGDYMLKYAQIIVWSDFFLDISEWLRMWKVY